MRCSATLTTIRCRVSAQELNKKAAIAANRIAFMG